MLYNASVQHNGGFLPGIIMLSQCYNHRGTRLNARKKFCILQLIMISPNRFDIFPRLGDAQEVYKRSFAFGNNDKNATHQVLG